MYKVKAIITIKGTKNKGYLEGLFCPKGETCEGSKIKTQCESYIRENMIKKGEYKSDELEIKISFSKLPADFLVVEDKV